MARYAPGLTPSELKAMTPEETRFVERDVRRMVRADDALAASLHGRKLTGF